jgi:hypothetical protein
MDIGQLLIKITIRAALALYVVVVAREITYRDRRTDEIARCCWATACVSFLIHVGCAFYFYHSMSHLAAFRSTALRTREMLGFEFGYGVYFSYLFALIWAVDAGWWLLKPVSYVERSRWLHAGVHLYLFFIAFNGAVIFEGGVTRWAGIGANVGLTGLTARAWSNGRWQRQPIVRSMGSSES